jgi:hypothetical protein
MTDFSAREATLDSAASVIGAALLAVLALAGPAYRYLQARRASEPLADGPRNEAPPNEK